MGAVTFGVGAYAPDAQEAFKKLIDEALYEYGHDPYSGTIATNDRFIMVPFLEGETIEDWHDRMIDNPDLSKWGPCACVESNEFKLNGTSLWHFAGWAAS